MLQWEIEINRQDMASEALTICVFMVCAALTGAISGDGYLRPTNEGPLACDAVRDVYNEMIGTSDETNDPVYQQPKYGEYGKNMNHLVENLLHRS